MPRPRRYKVPYEDLECCLITLRDMLKKMRQVQVVTGAIAVIDRALPSQHASVTARHGKGETA